MGFEKAKEIKVTRTGGGGGGQSVVIPSWVCDEAGIKIGDILDLSLDRKTGAIKLTKKGADNGVGK